MTRTRLAISCLLPCAAGLLFSIFAPPAFSADPKLTDDDRIEILRGMMSEYATVKTLLPRSKKPLPFDSSGAWNKEFWEQADREFGAAARVGDMVQVTHLSIESDKIVFEINGGMKGANRGSWKDHVQVGVGGVSPINRPQQNSNAPGGTSIALLFNGPVPPIKADDIKKIGAYLRRSDCYRELCRKAA